MPAYETQKSGRAITIKNNSSIKNLTNFIRYRIDVYNNALVVVDTIANKNAQLHSQVKRDQRLINLCPAAAAIGKFNIYPSVI